ncbi:MAG: hypothetical protein JWN30_1326 [Bacilli bacterium]|nr:hypothetical protein [Bacilli bacterium]
MQLYKVFYWKNNEPMHRETIVVEFLKAETSGALIRQLNQKGLNVERVVPYTKAQMQRELTPYVPKPEEETAAQTE